MAVKNLFGDLALDLSIKNLIGKLGRFSFDNTSQLRVIPTGGSISTITTVTTVTTTADVTRVNNSGLGANGINATSQFMTYNSYANSVGSNFVRS